MCVDDKASIEMELYVNKTTAPQLNSGEDRIDDILVLHLQGGKDLFVSFPLLLLLPLCLRKNVETLKRYKS